MKRTALFLFASLFFATQTALTDDQPATRPPELKLHVKCGPPVGRGEAEGKQYRDIPILGGTFEGPAIKGVVLKGGADRQREDKSLGVTWLDAEYDIMADDGTKIHVHNQGLLTKEGFFRASPIFNAPAGTPHEWLNHAVFTCALTPVRDGVDLSVRKVAKSRMLEDGGTGPHRAVMMEVAGFAEHTVFRPIDLSPFSEKKPLPVLVSPVKVVTFTVTVRS